MSRALLPLLALTPGALSLLACADPPVEAAAFTRVDLEQVDGAQAVSDRFVAALDATGQQALVMLPQLGDTALADALIRAWQRGVQVEVVTDVDQAQDPGAVALAEAGVPLSLADGAVTYFDYALNQDVSWASEDTIMSHATLVLDQRRVLNATVAGDPTTGDSAQGGRLLFTVESEDLAHDLDLEHNQVYGGIDATALTAFDSQAKSIADSRWRYPTQTDLDLEVWLGPQERVVKRVIDAVYSARKSVRILTDDLADEGLSKALQDKALAGFDVQVVVGPAFGTSAAGPSGLFRTQTPDVVKLQVADATVPTLVLIDVEEEGQELLTARAMVVSHPLYSAARIYRGTTVRTDQLIDGNLFVLADYDEPGEELLSLRQLWQDHADRGTSL